MTNSSFTSNSGLRGGAIYNRIIANIVNSTFVGNKAEEEGGGFYNSSTSGVSTTTNCIFWENSDLTGTSSDAQLYEREQGLLTVSNSIIQNWPTPGVDGNLSGNPLFVDADGVDNKRGTEDDNLRLQSGSLAIDAGKNDVDIDFNKDVVQSLIHTDLAGGPRFLDDPNTPDIRIGTAPIIDIGAYEFMPSSVLVGHWKLDELNWTGAENEVIDSSGLNNRGISAGDAQTEETGKVGRASKFDGTSGTVRIPNHESLRMTTTLTVSAWVKPDVQNGIGIILNKEGEYEVAIFPDNTVRFALANQSPGWIWINTGFAVTENVWSHIAWTYDAEGPAGSQLRLYVNGNVVFVRGGTRPIGDSITAADELRIGSRQAGGQFFHGVIDDVRVYSQALSADQVADLIRPGSLVGHWRLDELNWMGIENEVVDSSGISNHGTSSGEAQTVEAGQVGRAGELAGTDGMVRIPNHESLRMTAALTLSAWVKPDVQNGIGIILNKEGEYEVVIFPDNTVRFALANQSPG